ncbi:Mevalonate kinase [uncultured archaeon]|nr:Mevalonate kinase [uncultured archaeon]
MIIRSRAPVRISFAGGGTDVSPFTEEHGGCVVNVTINKYAWGTLSFRPDAGVSLRSDDYNAEIKYKRLKDLRYDGNLDLLKAVTKHFKPINGVNLYLRSDVPPRSGLGSSASAFVAAIGLFNHALSDRRITNYEIAELAFKLEREELHNLGGRQDQYAAVFGGLNYMEFKGNDFVRINPLRIRRDNLLELEKNIVLVHAQEREKSGDIIANQTKSYVRRDRDVVDALEETKALAQEVKQALVRGDFNYFGELLHQGWLTKKKFSPLMTTPFIDKLYKAARENGAIGGKITGAGGGGHMFFYCEPNTEHKVEAALAKAGAKPVKFSFDMHGLETWEVAE